MTTPVVPQQPASVPARMSKFYTDVLTEMKKVTWPDRPQFYFRTTDVTGAAALPEGVEMVMPGDNVQMVVELITPIAMEKELRFAIREGGRTVGAGVVTEIVE